MRHFAGGEYVRISKVSALVTLMLRDPSQTEQRELLMLATDIITTLTTRYYLLPIKWSNQLHNLLLLARRLEAHPIYIRERLLQELFDHIKEDMP